MKQLQSKPCRICGAPVQPTRRKDRKAFWYPRQCQDCYKRIRDPLAHKQRISAAMRGSNHPGAKPIGSRSLHTARDGLVYWLIKIAPTGKWPYEHRWLMAQRLGRPLRADEHVHHLDHDTLNNDPANLALLSHGDHTRQHHVLRDGQWSLRFAGCQQCGTTERRHLAHGLCTMCYQRKL